MSAGGLTLGIVGPCASGKSTLANALRERDYQAKHIAQEHSYVQDMWSQIGQPDFLVYLDVSFEEATQRRQLSWKVEDYQRQVDRLRHARENADLYIDTDNLTPDQVLTTVLDSI